MPENTNDEQEQAESLRRAILKLQEAGIMLPPSIFGIGTRGRR